MVEWIAKSGIYKNLNIENICKAKDAINNNNNKKTWQTKLKFKQKTEGKYLQHI